MIIWLNGKTKDKGKFICISSDSVYTQSNFLVNGIYYIAEKANYCDQRCPLRKDLYNNNVHLMHEI